MSISSAMKLLAAFGRNVYLVETSTLLAEKSYLRWFRELMECKTAPIPPSPFVFGGRGVVTDFWRK